MGKSGNTAQQFSIVLITFSAFATTLKFCMQFPQNFIIFEMYFRLKVALLCVLIPFSISQMKSSSICLVFDEIRRVCLVLLSLSLSGFVWHGLAWLGLVWFGLALPCWLCSPPSPCHCRGSCVAFSNAIVVFSLRVFSLFLRFSLQWLCLFTLTMCAVCVCV